MCRLAWTHHPEVAVHRRRAFVIGFVAASILLLAAFAGPSVARRLMHPRDSEAFQRYVSTYVGTWSSSRDPGGPKRDRAWVAEHPDQVLDEGDRACRWLAGRPDAPDIDPSGRTDANTLMGIYVKQAEQEHPLALSFMGRHVLTAGAWAYLCWSEREEKSAPRSRGDDD
jgi:hypothetical protein